jgi:ubiquinone/menaquinone biosynthesis C-methylase UbiE
MLKFGKNAYKTTVNYFNPQSTAERYAAGRPKFHALTIQQVKEELQLTKKLDKALDIACGTGLSTQALLEIAAEVHGTDASQEMLRNAVSREQIHYALSYAEAQPFPDAEFDMITVCSGIHWFDIDRFLLESSRLLKPQAYLILYDNFFLSEMEGEEGFKEWWPQVYLKKFPSPPRNNTYEWSAENLRKSGFAWIKEVQFKNAVEFTKEELVLYFTTQSNISDAVSRGEVYADIEHWLEEQLAPFFEDDKARRTLYFGNWIKYLSRMVE